jgi:hypothetical protein
MPDDYMWAQVFDREDGPWLIYICDGDDGHVVRKFDTQEAANELFEQLLQLAPFDMCELVETFNFERE